MSNETIKHHFIAGLRVANPEYSIPFKAALLASHRTGFGLSCSLALTSYVIK